MDKTKKRIGAPVRIDWERLDSDWRAGIKTPQQMADEYTKATGQKVTHQGIRAHFQKKNIERSLKGKIIAQAQQIVEAELIDELVEINAKDREKSVITANASNIANISIAHRKSLLKCSEIEKGLFLELAGLEGTNNKIDLLQKLTNTMKQRIELERKIYSLEDYKEHEQQTNINIKLV